MRGDYNMYDEHVESFTDSRFKTSKWCMICYVDNMRDDWRECIDDLIDVPGFYGLHDRDVDKAGETRKAHIHLSFFWTGNINLKTAKNIANRLSKPGEVCCPVGKPIARVRENYDYAKHDTEKARKDGKVQYPEENRVVFNGFDIGFYEQLSQVEKDEICWQISEMIGERRIKNLEDLRQIISKERDLSWFLVFKANNGFFDRLCRGVYLKYTDSDARSEIPESLDGARLAMADEVIARGEDGIRRVVCVECGKVDLDDAFIVYGGDMGTNCGICRECANRRNG